MKKTYIAPSMEVELFELDASIAGTCGIVVDSGPAIGGHTQCEGYIEIDPFSTYSSRAATKPSNVNFYEDTVQICDCYTTGGVSGYWAS